MINEIALANKIEEGFKELNHWYMFKGGKSFYEKLEKQEALERLRLTETKGMIELWRESIGKTSPNGHVIMEQCCYLTMCLEWNDDATILFDYKKKLVTCKNDNVEIVM